MEQSPENREEYLKAVHHDHVNIYNAIVDQDGLLARQMMRAHLSKKY
ncbi:FCD domain-containing protein [Acinetobacter pittii]|nr:FCD domain-containing protein [Acinetobacter pittii]